MFVSLRMASEQSEGGIMNRYLNTHAKYQNDIYNFLLMSDDTKNSKKACNWIILV